MRTIFIRLIIFILGVGFGYIKIESERASVEMGDFDLEIPDDD